jgi:hypothetical protein
MNRTFIRKNAGGIGISAILLLVPIVIFTSHIRVLPDTGSIDPWLYIGSFLDFDQLYGRFGLTYYISRLPWVLTGSALYSVVSPLLGQMALGTAVWLAYTTGLYCITRRFYAAEIACFVAFFGALNPLFVFHAFWGHVDVPSIAVCLLAMTLLVRSPPGAEWPVVAAGGLFAVAVSTHLFCLVVCAAGVGAWVAVCLTDRQSRTNGVKLILMGGAIATVALLVVGRLAYGRWDFWVAQIRIATFVLSGGWHTWAQPIREWVPDGGLSIPVGLLGLTGVSLALRRRAMLQDEGARFLVLFVSLILSVFLVTDFGMGGARLQHTFYYVFLAMPAALLLGPILHTWSFEGPPAAWLGGTFGAAAIACIYALGALPRHVPLRSSILYGGLAVGVAAFAVVVPRKRLAGLALLSALSIWMFVGCVTGERMGAVLDHHDQWKEFRQVIALRDVVNRYFERGKPIYFFYDNTRGSPYTFNGVNSLYLWAYSQLSSRLPQVTAEQAKVVRRPSSIVTLGWSREQLDVGLDTVQRLFPVNKVRVRNAVTLYGTSYYIAIVDVEPPNPQGVSD